ncbi:uncharacterized protein LOC143850369 [Tasmannia lanceolata]|uniref:uncharacterized protein LOC143850369 n=1 Tax=Tasmannia lanceolata TaxID=3420 RepID=UPI004062EE3A
MALNQAAIEVDSDDEGGYEAEAQAAPAPQPPQDTSQGIEVDPAKVKAIQEMPSPQTEKEIRGFLEKVQYLSRFITQLTKSDITYVTQKSVKGKIIAEQLADAPTEDTELNREFLDEGIMAIKDAPSNTTWTMYFDGASNSRSRGIGIVLVSPQDEHIPISIKLEFDCTNEIRGHPPEASWKEKRALHKLASRYVICGGDPYRRSFDGVQLLCVDEDRATKILEDVHLGVCGPHINGKMLAQKILRLGYFWTTLEANCFVFVKTCHLCQIHVPPSELHSLTSPWTFSVWGIDIISKISPKSSSGHKYILVPIHYFTKWIEVQSYSSISSASVAKFIKANILYRYGISHELISDNGSHFKKEVAFLCEEFRIKHYKSSPYRPQTNRAVEEANKNIKTILQKMTRS